MTESDKKSFKIFGKGALLLLMSFIAIIATAGVWDGVTYGLDSFYGYVAGINICAEGYLIYNFYKKLFSNEK